MNKNIAINDQEIINIFSKIFNEPSLEEKEAKRRAKIRKAKADFFNLNEIVNNTEAIMF